MAPNELLSLIETNESCTKRAPHTAAVHLERLSWEKLLSQIGSGGFMITLGFQVYLDQARAIQVANHFLLRVNRKLFGKRFPRHGQFLVGAVVLEHKNHSTRSSESPHFHFIVSPESFVRHSINEEELRAIVEHVAGRLRFPTLHKHKPLGPLVSGSDFVKVDRIEIANGLANYLTKDCDRFGPARDALNIGFFGIGGIEGL